jgi:antitoxin (DNA-binding transcriptional repressor) of toxin-antitoxin stability system
MIDAMSTVHMNETDVTANFADVLEKVRNGVEVIVERNHQPVAVIRGPARSGRLISEVLADLRARGSMTVPDDEFARDVEEGIRERSQPWNPPSWD